MNKTAKVGTRSKTAVKPVKKVSKAATAVKKAVKKRPAVRMPVPDENGWAPEVVPLAEVEVLAAKAVKMIKANRTASPEKKAVKLALVMETLEHARSMGGLSKGGAWDLKHPFGLKFTYIDWEAVLR